MTRRRERAFGVVVAASTLALLFGIGEATLRIGIARGVPALRDPGQYADWFSDDDFFKLHYRWVATHNTPARARVDPLLGWVPPRTPENPLGAITDGAAVPVPDRPAMLFFGDSFMEGVVGNAHSIPALTAAALPGMPAYNLGVGGYGVDQIYLRLRTTARRFARPLAVVGILTVDLDRSLLRVRAGPKPYFTAAGRRLRLGGVPVPSDPERWFREHPPAIRSYAAAWLGTHARRLVWGGEGLSPWRRRATERLNARVLEKLVTGARARGIPLLFVLFYRQHELGPRMRWRERFLKETFTRLTVPYVDTRTVLDRDGRSYRREGHLNAAGNARVAEAIAAALVSRRPLLPPAHDERVEPPERSALPPA